MEFQSMTPLYSYSPANLVPVQPIEGLDGNNQLHLMEAFTRLPEHFFLITEKQLVELREQLSAPQPPNTIWGLDPSDAALVNLGPHEVEDPTQLWLEIRPPFTFSHAQAQLLFRAEDDLNP